MNFKIFNFHIRHLRQNIYQAPKHPWKRSDTPEPAVFKFVKKSAIPHSFFFHLIQGWLKTGVTSHLSLRINLLRFIECRSTARYFCYRDSQWIVGSRSALKSGCVWHAIMILSYNAHAPTLLPWWSHVTEVSGPWRSRAQLSKMVANKLLLAYKIRSLIRSFHRYSAWDRFVPAVFRNKLLRSRDVATASQCIGYDIRTLVSCSYVSRESHWCMFNCIWYDTLNEDIPSKDWICTW